MQMAWIKYEKDTKSFQIPETLGLPVFKLQDLEQTDEQMEHLLKQNYDTIILSNEVAAFSENIVKKYGKKEGVKIVITPSKE